MYSFPNAAGQSAPSVSTDLSNASGRPQRRRRRSFYGGEPALRGRRAPGRGLLGDYEVREIKLATKFECS
jgi:hypothetical protein